MNGQRIFCVWPSKINNLSILSLVSQAAQSFENRNFSLFSAESVGHL